MRTGIHSWTLGSAAIAAAAGFLSVGCGPHNKAYLGPKREPQEIGIVEPASEKLFRHTYVAILEINEQDKIADWQGGFDVPAELLPGEYRFRVEYKQNTQTMGVPLYDIVVMISDAVVAAQHEETVIEFPVQAGKTHHIHYDVDRHLFFVRRKDAAGIVQPPALVPPKDAVQCVETPDRGAEFWCALVPTPTPEPAQPAPTVSPGAPS